MCACACDSIRWFELEALLWCLGLADIESDGQRSVTPAIGSDCLPRFDRRRSRENHASCFSAFPLSRLLAFPGPWRVFYMNVYWIISVPNAINVYLPCNSEKYRQRKYTITLNNTEKILHFVSDRMLNERTGKLKS